MLINTARGPLVDERALVDALVERPPARRRSRCLRARAGDRRGVVRAGQRGVIAPPRIRNRRGPRGDGRPRVPEHHRGTRREAAADARNRVGARHRWWSWCRWSCHKLSNTASWVPTEPMVPSIARNRRRTSPREIHFLEVILGGRSGGCSRILPCPQVDDIQAPPLQRGGAVGGAGNLLQHSQECSCRASALDPYRYRPDVVPLCRHRLLRPRGGNGHHAVPLPGGFPLPRDVPLPHRRTAGSAPAGVAGPRLGRFGGCDPCCCRHVRGAWHPGDGHLSHRSHPRAQRAAHLARLSGDGRPGPRSRSALGCQPPPA